MQQETTATTPGLTPVTLWSRQNEKGGWDYNHLEMGHVPEGTARPTPVHENHKSAWRKGAWQAELAHLTPDKPPRVVRQ